MLLFILNEEAIAAETKKTEERDLNSLSLSLSYTMTRVSVYMRALVYNEVVFSLFETKTSKKKRLFSSPKIFSFAKQTDTLENSSFSRSSQLFVTYSASLRRKGGASSISRDFLSKVSSLRK